MSAAATAPNPVARSNSRRQQSYSSQQNDRHQRPSSSAHRSTPSQADTPHRSESSSRSHGRGQSSSHHQPQQQSPIPQHLNEAARHEAGNLARSQSSRRSSSRDAQYSTPQRSDGSRGVQRSGSRSNAQSRYSTDVGRSSAPSSSHARSGQEGQVQVRKRVTVDAQTGTWHLGKTIGAGSMGKVKLAKNAATGEQVAIKIVPRQSTEDHHNPRDRERADHSKEVRTAREAAIVTLLNHPYICGMRDVVRTNYHWYMLFEYVNGGQMLDYIISHGRLKEKQARKFGRQIVSALDYCHRNSIVHRNLKIENILISKTGDIKIIDFGLSNLFSPRNHLKTFCGSLYFAAPELLQARQYTGPEVDVWSFGIVLYVLVCGKVPFDDQSMPQLHAKIKKGVVDYPGWLSIECKHLISRMLVTDPRQRASLGEVMNHGWMNKGFSGPPENYLPHREPLQLPLDRAVIEKMTGFDFGPSDYIQRELTRIIESDEYQHAVRMSVRDTGSSTPGIEKKRGVFDFYKRRSSIASRDTLSNISAEAVNLGSDPINAFSPLISVYYLVREKQEREQREANPGALALPTSPNNQALRLPDLPPPEAALTNASTYERSDEKPTGGRSRPRARTQGEDDVPESVRKGHMAKSSDQVNPTIVTTPAPQQATRKEGVAGGLLRRFSTRRARENPRADSSAPANLSIQPFSETATPLRKSFSIRRARRESPGPMIHSAGSQPQQGHLTPPVSASGSRTQHKMLGRSTSVNSADLRRKYAQTNAANAAAATSAAAAAATATDDGRGSTAEPPMTSGSDRSSVGQPRIRINEPAQAEAKPEAKPEGKSEGKPESKSDAKSPALAPSQQPATKTLASRTKSLGHARRESIQARRAKRNESQPSKQNSVLEETDQEGELTDSGEAQGEMKPVYLKGLFSVSTTSSKPLSVIRADIIRVLKQLGVDYNEIKGGFNCQHSPSIDLNQVRDVSPARQESFQSPTHKRRISFAGFRGVDREAKEADRIARSGSRRRAPEASFTASEDEDDEKERKEYGGNQAGETSTHVQNDMGENLVLRFEIFIVKVPLFSLHGIQFKKVSGGTWQYKNMAQKILDALRL